MTNPEIARTRSLLLDKVLEQIVGIPSLQEALIFQGGGALHLVYSSPRSSSDLDFVCPDYPAARSMLPDALPVRVLTPSGAYARRISKQDERSMRASYAPEDGSSGLAVKVEIWHQTAEEHAPAQGKFYPFRVESPAEIYIDKVIASLHRMTDKGIVKGTDLFDLHFIDTNFPGAISDDRFERKAASYNHLGWSRDTADAVLRYVADQRNYASFRHAIQKTLLPDVAAHLDFPDTFFQTAPRHFERLRRLL